MLIFFVVMKFEPEEQTMAVGEDMATEKSDRSTPGPKPFERQCK